MSQIKSIWSDTEWYIQVVAEIEKPYLAIFELYKCGYDLLHREIVVSFASRPHMWNIFRIAISLLRERGCQQIRSRHIPLKLKTKNIHKRWIEYLAQTDASCLKIRNNVKPKDKHRFIIGQ